MTGKAAARAAETAPPGDLSGVAKVTALLLAMTKPSADRIIKQLEDVHIRELARAALSLPEVRFERIEALAVELSAALSIGETVAGSDAGARGLLAGVVADETIGDIMRNLAGKPGGGVWTRLAAMPDAVVAAFVTAEEPQVAAYVLSNISPEKVSAVLEKLDAERRADLSLRLLGMRPISDEAARMIEDRITEELLGAPSDDAQSAAGGHARLGAILNQLDRVVVEPIMERIAARNPDDARKVKSHIFVFEEIAGLAPEDRSRLFDEIPSERTVLALRDCDPALVECILSALSPRTRKIAEAELAAKVNPPRKAILDARRSICATALSLAGQSLIRLAPFPAAESAA